MRRMPQARTTKSQARIDAFYDLDEKTKQRSNRNVQPTEEQGSLPMPKGK